ncbi:MAG TPA: ATP-binding protein [Thermoanaerobaculia bacterium]|nr:ATP-binding protein [Thermoanaerobaculia bacterium]
MGVARLDAARDTRGSRDPAKRLALTDTLLAEGDAKTCVLRTLEWLTVQAGVERGLCLVLEPDGRRLRGLAGLGLEGDGVEAMTVDLAQRTHPLVVALESKEPIAFGPPGESDRRPPPVTPLGPVGFTVLSLSAGAGDPRGGIGLLLVSGADGRPPDEEELAWAGGRLGVRLAALAYSTARDAEARRRREVEWLQGILEAVADPILLTDPEARILIANSGAEHLLTADEEAGEGRRRAVALNNMLFSASLFTNAEEGRPSRRELLLVDPVDGQDMLLELMTSPLALGKGETGVVSILRDVTDLSRATAEIEENYGRLRSAEAEVRAERDRLDVILNAVLDPVLVTDPDGTIVLMNPPAERLFTVPDSGRDREAERRVRANDAVFTSFASDLYAGRSQRWRKELTLSDPGTGEPIPMEAISAKTLARPGQEIAVVTILHDQSEAVEKALLYEQVKHHSEELEQKVREATAELADQNELLRRQTFQLEHASEMKSQFLANVSHELRTPLHAIVGYTSVLLEGMAGPLSPPQSEKLRRVDSNANHLLAIINDLLDLSRIESGKMPIRIDELRIAELFEEVRSEAESLIQASDLEVSFDAPEGMPRLATDRQKVKQILLNLLSNALKFTPEGQVRIVARHHADDQVTIAVTDTGIGISRPNQETIFDAFGQSESFYAASQTGTGLGLSICRRLATILGGDITLESELGRGSTFTLVLPRRSEVA